MRKLIKVTKKHINLGESGHPRSCPIALAAIEQLAQEASVGFSTISFKDTNWLFTSLHSLPRSAQRFIRKFDKYGKKAVKPFNFYLDWS